MEYGDKKAIVNTEEHQGHLFVPVQRLNANAGHGFFDRAVKKNNDKEPIESISCNKCALI